MTDTAATELLAAVEDLVAEGKQLDSWVAALPDSDWALPTPAAGWSIANQIGHLAWTDAIALSSVAEVLPDVEVETSWAQVMEAALANPTGIVDAAAAELGARPPATLLADWRSDRGSLAEALCLATAQPSVAGLRVPWFGPSMALTTMARARLMETWAHGLDVAHALSVEVTPHDRVAHVCQLGYAARKFAFAVRDLPLPEAPLGLALTLPGGEQFVRGPADAAVITGSAWEFAQVACRRLHPQDTTLQCTGSAAQEWLRIAQAFAGPPGNDPQPRSAK